MADFWGRKWWAWQGLNLRPLRCQHSDYGGKGHKSAIYANPPRGTARERTVILGQFHRSCTGDRFAGAGKAIGVAA